MLYSKPDYCKNISYLYIWTFHATRGLCWKVFLFCFLFGLFFFIVLKESFQQQVWIRVCQSSYVPTKTGTQCILGLMVKGYRSDALLLHPLNLLSSGAHAQAVLPCKIGVASSIHIVIYQLPVTYFLSFLHVCSLRGLFAALRHPGPPPHSQTMQSKSLTIHLRSWTDKSDPQTGLFSFLRVRLALVRYL